MNDYFPYEYVGGGYFRQKGVPNGTPAEILHGQQAIDFLLKKIKELEENHNSICTK